MSRTERPRHKPKHPDDDLTEDERAVEPPELDPEDEVERAAMESFPASDPPSFTPSHAGKPDKRPIPKEERDPND